MTTKNKGYKALRDAEGFFVQQLSSDKTVTEYIKSRNISGDMLNLFKIGYAPKGLSLLTKATSTPPPELFNYGLSRKNDNGIKQYRATFQDRLVFPIYDNEDRVCGFGGRRLSENKDIPKYLNSPESEYFDKSQILFSVPGEPIGDHTVLVEGYMDVVSLTQTGVSGVRAPMGTALTDNQAKQIASKAKRVTLMYDGDPAGRKASYRSLQLLLEAGMRYDAIHVFALPAGEDPDSWCVNQITESANAAIMRAPDSISWLIQQFPIKQVALQQKIQVAERFMKWVDNAKTDKERHRLIEAVSRYLSIDASRLNEWYLSQKKTVPNEVKTETGKTQPAATLAL